MNPKTVNGLLKVVLPHMLAYGIVIFIISHLIMSLVPGNIFIIKIIYAEFILAFLDIISGLFILISPLPGAWIRLFVFVLYTGGMLFLSSLLIVAVLRRKK